jgi:hypothetical protein
MIVAGRSLSWSNVGAAHLRFDRPYPGAFRLSWRTRRWRSEIRIAGPLGNTSKALHLTAVAFFLLATDAASFARGTEGSNPLCSPGESRKPRARVVD